MLYDSEFPNRRIQDVMTSTYYYKIEKWKKKYDHQKNSTVWLKTISQNWITHTDQEISSDLRWCITLLVITQVIAFTKYHVANCNIWISQHGIFGQTWVNAKHGHTDFMIMLAILVAHYNHHIPEFNFLGRKSLQTLVLLRLPLAWGLHRRESHMTRSISALRIMSDIETSKLFWIKELFRQRPVWIICRILTWACVVNGYAVFVIERDGGYCRGFGEMTWSVFGAMTGLGMYNHAYYQYLSYFHMGLVTIVGLVFVGILITLFQDLFKIPMEESEMLLEIEKGRCEDLMRTAACKFLQCAWRRYSVFKLYYYIYTGK